MDLQKGAQRLSASKRIAHDTAPAPTRQEMSAQRLSASKRMHPGVALFRRGRSVLNAFRHQRESHFLMPDRKSQSLEVLNAFRHQRESHQAIRGQVFGPRCSTPFGIKENRTNTLWFEPNTAKRVLNAFRHQRESHQGVTLAPGVTFVLNAFRHQRESHRTDTSRAWAICCAQRLSASKRIALDPGLQVGVTPFGIKAHQQIGLIKVDSAQRLSASKRIAPEPSEKS